MTMTSPFGKMTLLQNCRTNFIEDVAATTGCAPRMSMVKAKFVLVPVDPSDGLVFVLAEPPKTKMRPSLYIAKLPSFGKCAPGTLAFAKVRLPFAVVVIQFI